MPFVPRKKHKPRGFKNNPFYDTSIWKRARRNYIRLHPLCEWCGNTGTTIDHIMPMRLGGHPTDFRNLMTLCSSCHDSKSSKDSQKYRDKYKKL